MRTGQLTRCRCPCGLRRRSLVVAVGVILGLFLLVGLLGRGGMGVTLVYNDTNFVMRHNVSFPLNVFALQFVRGEDGQNRDDYAGDRIKG